MSSGGREDAISGRPVHRPDGVCALHWGARTGPKTYINPLRLLQPAVIRLKPVQ